MEPEAEALFLVILGIVLCLVAWGFANNSSLLVRFVNFLKYKSEDEIQKTHNQKEKHNGKK